MNSSGAPALPASMPLAAPLSRPSDRSGERRTRRRQQVISCSRLPASPFLLPGLSQLNTQVAFACLSGPESGRPGREAGAQRNPPSVVLCVCAQSPAPPRGRHPRPKACVEVSTSDCRSAVRSSLFATSQAGSAPSAQDRQRTPGEHPWRPRGDARSECATALEQCSSMLP